MKTLLMEEMTRPMISEAIKEGYDTVIVCAGAVEQHGKHLPIGMDAMDGQMFSMRIAEELGRCLVAPIIRPGCSDHHMRFAGTITLPESVLQDICRAYCRCLSKHGFKRIVLIASHGGNNRAMESVTGELDRELPCRVVWADIAHDPRVNQALQPILARYGKTLEEGGVHAGFVEAAILLASPYGHLVNIAAAERGFVGDARARMRELRAQGEFFIDDISPVGVLGDPRGATVEAGREIVEAFVKVYTQIISDALAAKENAGSGS